MLFVYRLSFVFLLAYTSPFSPLCCKLEWKFWWKWNMYCLSYLYFRWNQISEVHMSRCSAVTEVADVQLQWIVSWRPRVYRRESISEFFSYACSGCTWDKKEETMQWHDPAFEEAALVDIWHSTGTASQGLLLHVSACAALIIQCDGTEIDHQTDCVGLHYHQLHTALFDPKLHLNASEIWSTTFNQMYRLADLTDSSYSPSPTHPASLHRQLADNRSRSISQRVVPVCACSCNHYFWDLWIMITFPLVDTLWGFPQNEIQSKLWKTLLVVWQHLTKDFFGLLKGSSVPLVWKWSHPLHSFLTYCI